MAMNDEHNVQRLLAEQQLSEVDSIMEPEVIEQLKSFTYNGGQPRVKQAIRVLSDNYRGRAQMCNLLLEWMEMLGEKPADLHEEVMGHLKNLAVQQFDPKRADTVFATTKGEPRWLDFMIRDPGWRAILYKLAEEHPNCLLLNFVIQKISEEGHSSELAASATRSGEITFSVFTQVFVQSTHQIMQKSNEEFHKSIPEFQKLCCQTEFTYLFSQLLLLVLSRSPTGSGFIFTTLSRALSTYAVQHISDHARLIDSLLINSPTYPALHRLITCAQRSIRFTPTDIKKVYDLYAGPNPPRVQLIRIECMFQRLIEALFNASKPLPVASKTYHVYLLAYAACVKDNRAYYSTVEPSSNVMDTVVDKSCMNATLNALNDVVRICEDQNFGFHIAQSETTLTNSLSIPVCSAGTLHWIKLSLHHPDYYGTTYQSVCTPVFMRLLGRIASQHPLQRQPVFTLLCEAFHLHTDLDDLAVINFRKQILRLMLHLVHCGLVAEVTAMIASEVPRMDHALVRFFISQMLQTTAPPYSAMFVRSMFEIMRLPGAELALRNDLGSVQCIHAFAVFAQEHIEDFDIADLAGAISRCLHTTSITTSIKADDNQTDHHFNDANNLPQTQQVLRA